jgi:hypothetical protein
MKIKKIFLKSCEAFFKFRIMDYGSKLSCPQDKLIKKYLTLIPEYGLISELKKYNGKKLKQRFDLFAKQNLHDYIPCFHLNSF